MSMNSSLPPTNTGPFRISNIWGTKPHGNEAMKQIHEEGTPSSFPPDLTNYQGCQIGDWKHLEEQDKLVLTYQTNRSTVMWCSMVV